MYIYLTYRNTIHTLFFILISYIYIVLIYYTKLIFYCNLVANLVSISFLGMSISVIKL